MLNLIRLICISMIIVMMYSLAGCNEKRPDIKRPVRIGINIWAGYAYAFVAKEKGFFKKNNVDVELLLRKTTVDAYELFRNREVDGVFGAFPDVIMLYGDGYPSKVVYITDFSLSSDVIIGKPALHSLRDLRGKRIGVEGVNSFSHFFVLKMLENAGIRESEVIIRNVPAMEVLSEMEKNKLDAGHTWDPVSTKALTAGYNILGKAGDIPGIIIDGLFFSPDVIRERPDDIIRIIRSLIEARDFVNSNRDEAVSIMSTAEGVSKEEIENGIRGVILHNLEDNAKMFEKIEDKGTLYDTYRFVLNFFLERGQVSKAPAYDEIVEPDFIMDIYRERQGK